MKFLYIFGLIVIASVVESIGATDFTGRIVSGGDAAVQDAFVLRVLSVEDDETVDAHISSGAAINPNFGLIVAQAVVGFQYWYIAHNSIHVDQQEYQSIGQANITVHPDYNPITLENNIAVVKFTTPVEHFLPLATTPLLFQILLAFGYGYTDQATGTLPDTLQQLIILETEANTCIFHYPLFDAPNSICGIFPGQSLFADGDQGGAVTDSTKAFIHGLVSYWGEEMNEPVSRPVAIIQILPYRDFIEAVINGATPLLV